MITRFLDKLWLKLWKAHATEVAKKASPLVSYPFLVWLEFTDLDAILATGGRDAILLAASEAVNNIGSSYKVVYQGEDLL